MIAALAGVATLARSQGVGPRALKDVLPELRTACIAAPAIVASALLPSCDVVGLSTGLAEGARSALDQLVLVTREAATGVLAAIEQGERRGLGARSRLALQDACDHAVETLARVRWSIELLQRASMGEPLPVSLDDLLRELDFGELGGATVTLTLSGTLDVTVAVHPRVATAVLLGAVARTRAIHLAAGRGDGLALVVAAKVSGNRVRVEVRPHPSPAPGTGRAAGRGDARAPTVQVVVPDPAPYDELVLGLAAATMAAPITVEAEGVSIDLLLA
ncbi:MAG: hypothetical protein ABI175_10005 [Polyangiales bacterium]